MKESVKFFAILILLFIVGGVSLVWYFLEIAGTILYSIIFTILKVMPHLPTSVFDMIENIVSNNWTLTNLLWLDSILIHIASFIPSVIIFILGTFGLKINPKVSGMISLLVFILVLQLFSSILFWSLIIVITVITILVSVYQHVND